MALMLIRTTQSFVSGHGSIPSGLEIDAPDTQAVSWINSGLAVAVTVPPTVERAVKTPRNKALAPQANPSND